MRRHGSRARRPAGLQDRAAERSTGVTEPMNQTDSRAWRWTRGGALAAAMLAPWLTGCTVEMAGQTLPSPYYLTDDVQYYAPGPGFKLAREAAAMQEQKAAEISEPQGGF